MKLSNQNVMRCLSTILLSFFLISGITSCQSPITPTEIPEATPTPIPEPTIVSAEGLGLENYSSPLTPPATEITFQVEVPSNTPADQSVYFVLRDEVTGLAINAQSYPMQNIENPGKESNLLYSLTLTFPMGSVLKYRYERQSESVPIAEHISDETPVRYRLYHVEGPGKVDDVVSRWTDTEFIDTPGRILGKVTDIDTGEPIPNLLVAAGGAQTLTSSDGSFLIDGLPPAIHNLVVLSMDGSYTTFQQGARVESESSTPAEISIKKAPLVNIAFVVQLPENTPPIVPIKIAGSLYQFGNTFANLSGGISSLSSNMPGLTSLPDGRYLANLELPAGADLQYKYTMGDGFWNAEHTVDGNFRLRQLIIPEQDSVVIDIVDSWQSDGNGPITFDITVPANTPPGETVSIQFNPLFGWTVPIPMWSLGNGRWAYILFSPLNLPGDLQYRFCRNGQCNRTDDIRTAGERSPGFVVAISEEGQTINDNIQTWSMLPNPIPITTIITPTTQLDSQIFQNGVEFEASYHPSYKSLLPYTLSSIDKMNVRFLTMTPTWTYTQQSPPILQPVPGKDATWFDLTDMITLSTDYGYDIAVFPNPTFEVPLETWWSSATRDFSWWLVWFDHYERFLLHHADLAQLTNAQALIIGGDWVEPSLPSATLFDGTPSGVPTDSENRWRTIIGNIRQHYSGKIYWALNLDELNQPPAFLDAVDGQYILWNEQLTENPEATIQELENAVSTILDESVKPLKDKYNQTILIAIGYPSADGSLTGCALSITGDCVEIENLTTMNPEIFNLSLDLQEQLDAYSALLSQIQARDWINGVISRGFYPPAVLIDPSQSAHGKPLEELLQLWFDPDR